MSGFARATTRNTRSNDRLWENPFWTNRKKYGSAPIGFTFCSQFVFIYLQKSQFYFTIFTFPCSAFHGIDTVTRHAFTWLPCAHCTNFGRVFLRLRFLHKLSILEPFSVKKPYFLPIHTKICCFSLFHLHFRRKCAILFPSPQAPPKAPQQMLAGW